jgi:hypothetical protein
MDASEVASYGCPGTGGVLVIGSGAAGMMFS